MTPDAHDAAFGVGGFRHPVTGERLVVSQRTGFELVVSAHKSVAVLGVVDRGEDRHSILDVETTATMDWLDDWFQDRGGRRGRARLRTATGGLTHARSPATAPPEPETPHRTITCWWPTWWRCSTAAAPTRPRQRRAARHRGGGRDGRAAPRRGPGRRAGLHDRTDDGRSGNLPQWRITGVSDDVCEVFPKRSDEIVEHLASTGYSSYRARGIAARVSCDVKRHTGVDELLPQWRSEMEAISWPVERVVVHWIPHLPGRHPCRSL